MRIKLTGVRLFRLGVEKRNSLCTDQSTRQHQLLLRDHSPSQFAELWRLCGPRLRNHLVAAIRECLEAFFFRRRNSSDGRHILPRRGCRRRARVRCQRVLELMARMPHWHRNYLSRLFNGKRRDLRSWLLVSLDLLVKLASWIRGSGRRQVPFARIKFRLGLRVRDGRRAC